MRFKSSLEYKKDSTVTRLLSLINKLEAYVSYTLLPTYSTNNISSISSNTSSESVTDVYKEFLDEEVAYEWGIQNFAKWLTTLLDDEIEALRDYKLEGKSAEERIYAQINYYLRYKKDTPEMKNDSLYKEKISNLISKINSSLNKSVIPEKIVVYRAEENKTNFDFGKLIGGLPYTPKAFFSTALNKSGADTFLSMGRLEGKTMVFEKIFIKKGAKGAFMEGIKRMAGDGNEILLPANSKFKVLSSQMIDGIQYLELELL